ncbi:hypothetical protein Shyd_84620 [Streptomyces hydrogenans]|uniref:Uncharacterized protein n=1 Tax=Streptomyces hydrogenans TaxID=1873719 RepID=A0ABQ3PPZ9_9ACTN|nr:hypothetical protein Shyd_84620 [Streptomyces hydrogenans]
MKLLQAGERRGRGQAVGADIDGLHAITRACPDTLTGERDKALVLTGFRYASRSQDRPDSSPATSRCTRTASWSTSSLARPSTPCAPHGCRTTRIPRSARSAPGPPTAPA